MAERRAGSGGRGGAESGDAELCHQTGDHQRNPAAETHEGCFLWQVTNKNTVNTSADYHIRPHINTSETC